MNNSVNYPYLAGVLTAVLKNIPNYVLFNADKIGVDVVDISKFRNALEKHIDDEITRANKEGIKYNN
jgi:hypothetical protein